MNNIVLSERIAQIAAHRACCGTEHNPAEGKLHGYCVVCGVPWPCDYAGKLPALESSAIRNMLRAMQNGELTVSRGVELVDMWLAGVPIEQIQLLCGHEDKATTEQYIV